MVFIVGEDQARAEDALHRVQAPGGDDRLPGGDVQELVPLPVRGEDRLVLLDGHGALPLQAVSVVVVGGGGGGVGGVDVFFGGWLFD